ncbi:unnamed protein product [Penicillium bialowiezense]
MAAVLATNPTLIPPLCLLGNARPVRLRECSRSHDHQLRKGLFYGIRMGRLAVWAGLPCHYPRGHHLHTWWWMAVRQDSRFAHATKQRHAGARDEIADLDTPSNSVPTGDILIWGWDRTRLALDCTCFGIGLFISILYAVESHRPIAGEVVVSQLSFKGAFGFLLSFYTNPWIDSAGYSTCFGILAGINAAVLIMWIPLYIWGKQIRAWYTQLRLTRFIQWKPDREVGE